MKRFIVFALITFFGFSIHGQNTVSISGQVSNQSSNKISLSIRDFDTVRMLGDDDKAYRAINQLVKADILPDSSFSLSTDKIIRPFTICSLKFGTKSKEIILSPGDSIEVDLDYYYFNSELEFWGLGAEKNNYWNDILRLRIIEEGKKAVSSLRTVSRINQRKIMMDEELELLEDFREDLDSAFYDWESRRIRYDCYDSNVRFSIWYNDNTSKHINETEAYNLIDFEDEEALLTMECYRSLIRNYREIHIAPESSVSNGDMLLMFRLGEQMSGLVRTYFLWHVISNAVTEAVDNREKQLILDFAIDHVKDSKTEQLAQNMESKLYGGFVLGKSFSESWFTASLILGGIFFLAILALLIRNIRTKNGKVRKPSNISYLRVILILILLVFALILIGNGGVDSMLPYVLLVLIIIFTLIHNRISLRLFFIERKYVLYSISTLILLSAFTFAFYLAMKAEYNRFDKVVFYGELLPISITTSILMILYAFTFYYAGLARKQKNGWSSLVEQKVLNIEPIFHVIIVSALIIAIAVNMSRPADFRVLIEIFLGLLIFYTTAFLLVSKFLLKNKYVQFVFYSTAFLFCCAVLISFLGGIFTYAGLHSRGISISFFKSLDIPSLDLLIFALPAVVYAYARKMYIDREAKGYSLYHQKDAEFNQLRSQVNPHFLFNSLNTVYAFALKEGNEKTAESIAKLANLMRYLIEDMEKDEIPIKKEIGYIEDYVKLQLIRSSVDHDINLKIDLDEEQEGKMIAPMLMIPFVENAFKHGVNPNSRSNVNMKVSFVDGQFQFVLENSVDKNFEAFYKEKGFGIGIENLRKRLEHIYPDKHTLSIADTDGRFIVIMEISL